MKTRSIILGAFCACLISTSAFGQEPKEEVKEVKKEVRKEIRMEDENGVKTLTIITDENGEKTEEIFVGEEAEAKLAELMPQMEEVSEEVVTEEKRIEVEVDDDGNLQSVTVKTSINGEETIEVYEGEEAEQKLEEFQNKMETEILPDEKGVEKKKRSQKSELKKVDIKE